PRCHGPQGLTGEFSWRRTARRLTSTAQTRFRRGDRGYSRRMALSVGHIVGSISSQAINRRLAAALVRRDAQRDPGGAEPLQFSELEIVHLPFYNYDLDGNFPQVAETFKQSVRSSDALMIVTPEYNRSIPGVLKNAIDWASRPYGDNAFAGKPVGI